MRPAGCRFRMTVAAAKAGASSGHCPLPKRRTCRAPTRLSNVVVSWMKPAALSALGRRTETPPVSWLMATALARPELISLAAGFTDSESLPVKETRKLFAGMLRSRAEGRAALQYGTTAGDLSLRQLTAERVRALDGASGKDVYGSERMVLTNGSQQLLYMVTEALCDPGDIVLVEDPTYFVFLGILQSHGIEARGVRLQPDGLDLEHLESVLRTLKKEGRLSRLKLLYIVSYHQNPTTTTTSFSTKSGALALLRQYERAAGHPIYVLEDAAYRELRFSGEDVLSALAVPGAGARVIYAGTYSKPFATGIRVGFGLLPEPVLGVVLRIKGNHDFGSSNVLQKMLVRAIGSGMYERHLLELRKRYAHKAALMGRALEEHMPPGVRWGVPGGGLYYWASVPPKIATGFKSKLFQAALRHEVLYVPGQPCYAADPARPRPNHEMRLSFGAESDAHLEEGVKRLAAALKGLITVRNPKFEVRNKSEIQNPNQSAAGPPSS